MTEFPFGISSGKTGVFITLKVSPGASREGLLGPHGDALKIAVREVPERGKANRAVLRLLGRALGVGSSELEIVSGAGTSRKRVLVRSLSAETVLERIRKTLESRP